MFRAWGRAYSVQFEVGDHQIDRGHLSQGVTEDRRD